MKNLARNIEALPWQWLLFLTLIMDGVVGAFYRFEKKHYLISALMVLSFAGIIISFFLEASLIRSLLFWICLVLYLCFLLGDLFTILFFKKYKLFS